MNFKATDILNATYMAGKCVENTLKKAIKGTVVVITDELSNSGDGYVCWTTVEAKLLFMHP